MISDSVFNQILENYELQNNKAFVTVLKSGLIHKSYKLDISESSFLLQKINTTIFTDVESLMHNISLVTKTLSASYRDLPYETLDIVTTKDDKLFCITDSGTWRMYKFKKHLYSRHVPENDHMVFEAGKAFAHFVKALSKINPGRLSVIIPYFHSLEKRFDQLRQAFKNSGGVSAQIEKLVGQISEYFNELVPLEQALQNGEIPLRITHNDSKFDNILFDNHLNARCIVDLDTVMPGIIHFDVGDCLRTLTPVSREDEPDLQKVKLKYDFYTAFLRGYKTAGADFLTQKELEFLPYSAPYMSLIMCIRFLTDYLSGNNYYMCEYPEHNLVRSICQLEVTKQFLSKYPLMQSL